MQSVWQEDLQAHRERLAALCNQYNGGWDDDATPDEKALCRIGYVRDLSLARDCLECEAHFTHQTDTRMRRGRTQKEWSDAGVSNNSSNFYQDARLNLVVRFDEDLRQFVPMTTIEYLVEHAQSISRHGNEAAAGHIHEWEQVKLSGPLLYKRGRDSDLLKQTTNGHTRLATAKEEWGTDKATLLQYPTFTAYQAYPGRALVVVQLWEGETLVDSWLDNGPGGSWGQLTGYHPSNSFHDTLYGEASDMYRGGTIAVMKCPPELYAAHIGQVYVKPGSAEAYAYHDTLPNPVGEFTLDGQEFVDALKYGVVAASKNMDRPILESLLLEIAGSTLRVISTDCYRLLLQDVDLAEKSPGAIPNILLPREFARFVAQTAKKPVGMFKVRIGQEADRHIMEITGEVQEQREIKPVRFVSRCEEGQYINYGKVIPSAYQHRLLLDPTATTKALKELQQVAVNDNNRVVWRFDGQQINVSASSGLTPPQSAEIELTALESDGSRGEIAFNAQYARDYLSWQDKPVSCELSGPLNSFVFVNGRTKLVLMPMQIM